MKQTLYLLKYIGNKYWSNTYLNIVDEQSPCIWEPDWKRATLFSDNANDYYSLRRLEIEKDNLIQGFLGEIKKSDFKIIPITVEMED